MRSWSKPLIAGLTGLLLLALSWHSATHSIDVEQLRVVGAQVLRGDFEFYPAGVYEGQDVHPHGFGYAPALAFLCAPLALLPLEVVAFLIFWLKIAAIVHVVAIVSRLLGVERRSWMRVGGLAFLGCAGYVLEELRGGNIHFLTLWLVVVAIDQIERGRIVWPGVALALAIAAKVMPGLFLVPLLLRRQYGVAAATLGALAGILLLPIPVVGLAMNTRLIRGFWLFAASKVNGASNEAFRGLFTRLLTGNPVIGQGALRVPLTVAEEGRVNTIWLIFAVIVMLALLGVAVRATQDIRRRLLVYSAVVMAILLIAPHTQRIYFCTMFFPCLVFAALLTDPAESGRRRLIQAALVASFLVSSLLPAVMPGRDAAFAYERLWPHAFLTLAMFGMALVLAGNRSVTTLRTSVSSPP